jgi:hypothetical protein
MAVDRGREARQRASDAFRAMSRGEDLAWTADRRYRFPDGTTLQLEFEVLDGVWPAGAGRTRAVIFDSDGTRVDESEWFNDPQVRFMLYAVPRLRAMVDAQLASNPDRDSN